MLEYLQSPFWVFVITFVTTLLAGILFLFVVRALWVKFASKTGQGAQHGTKPYQWIFCPWLKQMPGVWLALLTLFFTGMFGVPLSKLVEAAHLALSHGCVVRKAEQSGLAACASWPEISAYLAMLLALLPFVWLVSRAGFQGIREFYARRMHVERMGDLRSETLVLMLSRPKQKSSETEEEPAFGNACLTKIYQTLCGDEQDPVQFKILGANGQELSQLDGHHINLDTFSRNETAIQWQGTHKPLYDLNWQSAFRNIFEQMADLSRSYKDNQGNLWPKRKIRMRRVHLVCTKASGKFKVEDNTYTSAEFFAHLTQKLYENLMSAMTQIEATRAVQIGFEDMVVVSAGEDLAKPLPPTQISLICWPELKDDLDHEQVQRRIDEIRKFEANYGEDRTQIDITAGRAAWSAIAAIETLRDRVIFSYLPRCEAECTMNEKIKDSQRNAVIGYDIMSDTRNLVP